MILKTPNTSSNIEAKSSFIDAERTSHVTLPGFGRNDPLGPYYLLCIWIQRWSKWIPFSRGRAFKAMLVFSLSPARARLCFFDLQWSCNPSWNQAFRCQHVWFYASLRLYLTRVFWLFTTPALEIWRSFEKQTSPMSSYFSFSCAICSFKTVWHLYTAIIREAICCSEEFLLSSDYITRDATCDKCQICDTSTTQSFYSF